MNETNSKTYRYLLKKEGMPSGASPSLDAWVSLNIYLGCLGHPQAWALASPPFPHIETWYVSIVSIIFDCSMPIFFNFHILLATFYIIFGTNILIQCPVPVPVCCMFYVSQKPHIKWSPNGIKTDGELFWNICDFWEVKSTRDGARGGQEIGGAP